MQPGISLKKIWSDEHLIELKIDSFDGNSLFSNEVYVGHQEIEDLIEGLNTFKDHVHGGIYDIQLGEFGPEYANGAFQARLHFHSQSKLHITINAQSDFEEFGMKKVASEATLYLVSEAGLLDNFIVELRALKADMKDEAKLEATNNSFE